MWLLVVLSLLLWVLGLGATVLGTAYTLLRFAKRPAAQSVKPLPPISILKPLKDVEPGMKESLTTFFELDYPEFELIFCVAQSADPAVRLVRNLINAYPRIKVRLHIGAHEQGANPKVNNLLPGYRLARYDLLLISDSNVRVWPGYLKQLAMTLGENVGVVTAVVAGRGAQGIGGRLEAAYLNTFFARWMQIAYAVGHPCVIGKTMLFRRSVMERFGGLKNLARYVAEDYMAGEAMRRLGYKIEILSEPVSQHIGNYSFHSFWARHLRWGRIRRSQSPPAFLYEPIQTALGSGAFGAWAVATTGAVSLSSFLITHFTLWAVSDALMIRRLEGRLSLKAFLAWVLRECLAIPHWVHMALSNKILWRGHLLRIHSGGLVDEVSVGSGDKQSPNRGRKHA